MSDFVDFEIWLKSVQVVGYLDTQSKEVCWYGSDGLEAYDDFSKTNYVGETANTLEEVGYLWNWCLIEDFLSKVDIIPYLLKHQDTSDDVKITFGTDDESIRLELWIKGDCE